MKVLNMEMHGQLTCTSSDGSRLGSRELHKRVSSECDGGDVSRQKSLHDAPGDFRPHATDPFVECRVLMREPDTAVWPLVCCSSSPFRCVWSMITVKPDNCNACLGRPPPKRQSGPFLGPATRINRDDDQLVGMRHH